MEYAIIGLVAFIIGVIVGLLCKVNIRNVDEYDRGFSDASMAVEFLKKRMEGK
jgi:ABC-type lipoprotein release transport system permease subunit